jgi:hypothetical protein
MWLESAMCLKADIAESGIPIVMPSVAESYLMWMDSIAPTTAPPHQRALRGREHRVCSRPVLGIEVRGTD